MTHLSHLCGPKYHWATKDERRAKKKMELSSWVWEMKKNIYMCSCHFMVFGFIYLNLFGSFLEMGISHCGVHQYLNCSNQLYPSAHIRFIAIKPSLEWLWQLKFVQKCDGKFVDLYKLPFISIYALKAGFLRFLWWWLWCYW